MTVQTSYPGVYVREAPSGARTIVGVSTSVTAFVGAAGRGPTDEPVRVRSAAAYARTFGPQLDESRPMGHAVAHFFANGGAEALVVRVAGTGAGDADTALTRGATTIFTTHARGAGAWANRVGGSGMETTVSYADTTNPADLFHLVVRLSAPDPRTGESVVTAEESFGNLSMSPPHPRYFRNVLQASELTRVDPAAEPTSTDQATSTGASLGAGNIDLTAAQSRLRVSVDHGAPTDLVVGPFSGTKAAFTTALENAATAAGLPVAVTTASNAIVLTTTGTGGAGRAVTVSVAPQDDASQALLLGRTWGGTEVSGAASLRPDVGTFAATGGVDGTVGPDDLVPAGGVGGIYSLGVLDFPRFNLLCLPDLPASDPSDAATAIRSQKLSLALSYCREQRAFLIVDTPPDWDITPSPNLGGLPALGEHGAIYYPRVTLAETSPGGLPVTLDLPPSGALAGLFARTDASSGVWKAPAGLSAGLVGISGLTLPTDDGLSGEMNPRGINVLRTFPGAGTVAWGARTLKGADSQASESKYIPVRRLTDYIASSLYLGTQFAVFEPNDPDLWATLRLAVASFMRTLFTAGAFQQSPARAEGDSFFVRCDETTNPQTEIDLGRVNVVVGFAPLKPAEFVIVTITQISRLEA